MRALLFGALVAVTYLCLRDLWSEDPSVGAKVFATGATWLALIQGVQEIWRRVK